MDSMSHISKRLFAHVIAARARTCWISGIYLWYLCLPHLNAKHDSRASSHAFPFQVRRASSRSRFYPVVNTQFHLFHARLPLRPEPQILPAIHLYEPCHDADFKLQMTNSETSMNSWFLYRNCMSQSATNDFVEGPEKVRLSTKRND